MGSTIQLPGKAHFRSVLAVVLLAVAVLFAIGAVGATSAEASSTAPTLGKVAPFAVLAHTTVTNTGPTVVSGDLGVYPGSAVTGFTTSTPPGLGTVTNGQQYKATAVAKTAQASLSVAYTQAAAAPSTQSVTGKNLAGMRLSAGVYTSTSAMALTGAVTLTGTTSSVFIFQAASTLITGTGSSVVLAGGVQACNVFWQVGSSATLKTGTTFFGTVMASTSASLTKTVTLTGRVLVKTGAVTLLSDHVTVPTCNTTTTTTTTTTTAPTTTTTAPTTTTTTPPTTTTTAPPTATPPAATPPSGGAPPAVASAVVPTTHTGEPWAGWLYWLLVAVVAAAGFGLIADRARRRHMAHQEDG